MVFVRTLRNEPKIANEVNLRQNHWSVPFAKAGTVPRLLAKATGDKALGKGHRYLSQGHGDSAIAIGDSVTLSDSEADYEVYDHISIFR